MGAVVGVVNVLHNASANIMMDVTQVEGGDSKDEIIRRGEIWPHTDTADLSVEPLLSHSITREFNSPTNCTRTPYVHNHPYMPLLSDR